MSKPAQILELVTFRAAAGVAEAQVVEAAKGTTTWLKTQPGFISRQLSTTVEGEFIDSVIWSSLEDALAAAAAIESAEPAGAFMAAIDVATVNMRHATILDA